jgi:hypothetical protein
LAGQNPLSIGRLLQCTGFTGPHGPYFSGEFRDHFSKARGFGRRHPVNGKTLGINARIFQDRLDNGASGQGFFITFQVMAFPGMSPHDNDTVSPFAKSFYHHFRVDHAGTHHPDCPEVWRILDAHYSCQIPAGICTPVAQKTDDFRLK